MAKGSIIVAQWEGADALLAAFADLRESMRRSAIKKAVTKGANILVRPVRRATPRSKTKFGKQAKRNPPGTTRKSTGAVVRVYKGGNLVSGYVGHRWPKGAAAHLSDQGTKERHTKKGHARGRVVARNWFKPAYQSALGQVESTIVATLRTELEKARAKAAAKAASIGGKGFRLI